MDHMQDTEAKNMLQLQLKTLSTVPQNALIFKNIISPTKYPQSQHPVCF